MLGDMGNKRAVRILLECILIFCFIPYPFPSIFPCVAFDAGIDARADVDADVYWKHLIISIIILGLFQLFCTERPREGLKIS